MQNRRWWKPLLAFLITFGVLAIAGTLLRGFLVYQHFYALGMQTDDPAVAADAARELTNLDRHYAPVFLAVEVAVSALVAGVLVWRRPPMPAPLPLSSDERRAETR